MLTPEDEAWIAQQEKLATPEREGWVDRHLRKLKASQLKQIAKQRRLLEEEEIRIRSL